MTFSPEIQPNSSKNNNSRPFISLKNPQNTTTLDSKKKQQLQFLPPLMPSEALSESSLVFIVPPVHGGTGFNYIFFSISRC